MTKRPVVQDEKPIGFAASLSSPRAVQVHAALHKAILDHRLEPGRPLPEDEIGTVYGVSRTLVRSAIQALAHERLVTVEPNKGARVAKPDAEEARQIFEARSLIEPRLAGLAALRARPADVAELRDHIRREAEALEAGDNQQAISLSAAFHRKIAQMADHRIFSDIASELMSRSSLIVALYWRRRDTTCERHAHGALVDAIAKGDEKGATELMLSHIVDLLSGLNLRSEPRATSLAEVLGNDLDT